MGRTKWLRLVVDDLSEVLRWAGRQNARRLDGFRCRRIHGREIVSFRLIPRYRIDIGSHDIVVAAFVRDTWQQRLARRAGRMAARLGAARKRMLRAPRVPVPAVPACAAEVRRLPLTRR